MNGIQFLKGLVIIAIGTILLFNNLNMLSWSVWYNIIKLWPLLLVSLGISLIFRKRLAWLGPLVILIGIFIGSMANFMGIDLNLEGKITTETEILQRSIEMIPAPVLEETKLNEDADKANGDSDISEDEDLPQDETDLVLTDHLPGSEDMMEEMVPGIQRASLRLNYDVGTFVLKDSTDLLYQCQVTYRYPEFKPMENYSVFNQNANLFISHHPITNQQQIRNPKNLIDLKLNENIIYSIFIETGATNINYDLSRYKIEELSIKSGASNIDLTVPQYHSRIDIDSGVSKINIMIPPNIGAMIQLDTGLTMKDLNHSFKLQNENVYVSDNYEESEFQVNIDINAGLSQISVHYQ